MRTTTVRRLLAIGAVALLLATAGCSTGVLTGNGDDGGNGDDAGASGYDVAGSALNGTDVDDSTAAGIERAGSYTYEQRLTQEATGTDASSTYDLTATKQVDFEAERGLTDESGTLSEGTETTEYEESVFTGGDASYQTRTVDGEEQTSSTEDDHHAISPVNVTAFDETFEALVDDIDWQSEGTEQFEGVSVTSYDATGVASDTDAFGENATIEELTGTLKIDADGIVRYAAYTATATDETGTSNFDVEVTISDVGSTTVSEPGWVANIRDE